MPTAAAVRTTSPIIASARRVESRMNRPPTRGRITRGRHPSCGVYMMSRRSQRHPNTRRADGDNQPAWRIEARTPSCIEDLAHPLRQLALAVGLAEERVAGLEIEAAAARRAGEAGGEQYLQVGAHLQRALRQLLAVHAARHDH